ncbi:uncharacterized protein METZ01_LOCUS475935, partial [marine metagenome]
NLDLTAGTLEVGGTVSLDGINLGSGSLLRLNSDTVLSSSNPFELSTIDLQRHRLKLATEATDITLKGNLIIEIPGEEGFDTGNADLNVDGSLTVKTGFLSSSGGTLVFSGPAQFTPLSSALELKDTILDIRSSLQFSSLLRIEGNTGFVLNGNALNLSGASIELGGTLSLDGVSTDSSTHLKLLDDSSISSNGTIPLGRLLLNGHNLTLSTPETELSLLGLGLPETPDTSGATTGVEMNPVIDS